jgi:hypothetical protein
MKILKGAEQYFKLPAVRVLTPEKSGDEVFSSRRKRVERLLKAAYLEIADAVRAVEDPNRPSPSGLLPPLDLISEDGNPAPGESPPPASPPPPESDPALRLSWEIAAALDVAFPTDGAAAITPQLSPLEIEEALSAVFPESSFGESGGAHGSGEARSEVFEIPYELELRCLAKSGLSGFNLLPAGILHFSQEIGEKN